MYYEMNYNSPIGPLVIVSNGEDIIGVWMKDQKYYKNHVDKEKMTIEKRSEMLAIIEWLDDYFAGKRPSIQNLKFKPNGTTFQQDVWRILMSIPYGELVTYGDIAKQLAKEKGLASMSAQAVGGAVGHNPMSIIIPCHRVVGSNRSLTGYAGGLDKKTKLLEFEGIDVNNI